MNDAIAKLQTKLEGWLDTLIVMLPNLVVAVLVVLVFGLFARLARKTVNKLVGRLSDNAALRRMAGATTSVGVVLVGLFVALSILQLDKTVTSLLAGAGVVGLALAFAFQDIAANFLAGVMISLRKPFVPGDLVDTHDFFGTIELVDMRNTTLRTPDGQRVLIPNRHVFENPLRNYTAFNRRRIDLEVGVSYGDDLEKVKRVTLEAVAGVSTRDAEKEIDLFFTGFGDSSINLVVRFWIDFFRQGEYLAARSEAIIRIKKAYDDADITIPFPIRTLDFGIKGGADLGEVAPRLKVAGE